MVPETFGSRVARLLAVIALFAPVCAGAQSTTLLNELHTIAAATASVPVEHTFTSTIAGAYTVTLTDVGAGLTPPTPLSVAKMAVTQGTTIVGTPAVLQGTRTATLTFTATANTSYTLHVVGTPAQGVTSGLVGEEITAPDGSSAGSYADSLAPPTPLVANGEAILSDTFTVATSAEYTVTLTDYQLPKALQTLVLAIVPTGGTPLVTLPAGGAMQATAVLSAGSYQIVAIGKTDSTDPTAVGGLFSASVTGASGSPPYPAKIVTVGAVAEVQSNSVPAGSYSLQLADLSYPTPLASLAAVLVRDDGGPPVAGPLTAAGSQSFTVATTTTNKYLAFAVATPQSSATGLGSYSLQVQPSPAATPPISAARIVGTPSTSSTTYPSGFSFDETLPGAGSYTATVTDFGFPGPLASINLAAVQNGAVVATLANNPGSLTINASTGPLTLLAYSQANSGGGLFGIDISSAGGTPVLRTTQAVGTAFVQRSVAITTAGSYQVTATDVGFPANFASLYVLVTQGPQQLGKILGGGTFSFNATPGNYFVNFIALPGGSDLAGTYALSVAPTPPAPTVTLTSSASSVASGGTVMLTWSTQNATSCSASDGWSGMQSANGSATSPTITTTTKFTLTCTGPGGSVSQSVSVSISSSTPSGGGGGGGGGALSLVTLFGLAGCLLTRACLLRAAPRTRLR